MDKLAWIKVDLISFICDRFQSYQQARPHALERCICLTHFQPLQELIDLEIYLIARLINHYYMCLCCLERCVTYKLTSRFSLVILCWWLVECEMLVSISSQQHQPVGLSRLEHNVLHGHGSNTVLWIFLIPWRDPGKTSGLLPRSRWWIPSAVELIMEGLLLR